MKVKVWWNDRWKDGQININVVGGDVIMMVASRHQVVSVPLVGEQVDEVIDQLQKSRVATQLVELQKQREKLKNLRKVPDLTPECCAVCRVHEHMVCPPCEDMFTNVCDLFKPLYEWPDGSRRNEPPPEKTDATD